MTKAEAKYIVDYFDVKCNGRGFKGDVKNCYQEAERILLGKEQQNNRGCTCEYPVLCRMVHNLREQYNDEIMKLYNEEEHTEKLLQTKSKTPKSKRKK